MCRIPIHNNFSKYQEFVIFQFDNENDLNEAEKELFTTEPNQLIHSIGFGRNYAEAMQRLPGFCAFALEIGCYPRNITQTQPLPLQNIRLRENQ